MKKPGESTSSPKDTLFYQTSFSTVKKELSQGDQESSKVIGTKIIDKIDVMSPDEQRQALIELSHRQADLETQNDNLRLELLAL
ncbi:MAG: hypothetical protein KKD44_17170, partial [Proteobacteria bacterium]|nr:hypothetical protein [Pseudomonadota bacterium]